MGGEQRAFDQVIFDVDGVLLTERRYFDATRLTLWEVLTSGRYLGLSASNFVHPGFLDLREDNPEGLHPATLSLSYKGRALNSNWDITYASLAVLLTHFLRVIKKEDWEIFHRLVSQGLEPEGLAAMSPILRGFFLDLPPSATLVEDFFASSEMQQGHAILEHLGRYFYEKLRIYGMRFDRGEWLWGLCHELFQAWYLNTEEHFAEVAHSQRWGADEPPTTDMDQLAALLGIGARTGNRSLCRWEEPMVPPEELRGLLKRLADAGIGLACATGRPRRETEVPLENLGLAEFFTPQVLSTFDEVEAAERELRVGQRPALLSKPHGFSILRALYPDQGVDELLELIRRKAAHPRALMVGDTPSDVLAARQAGCRVAVVVSGAGAAPEQQKVRRERLEAAKPDYLLHTVLELPSIVF